MVEYNRKDNDCHKYMVPEAMLPRFDELLEKLQTVKLRSTEYYDLEAEFSNEFHQYMVG